MRRTARLRLRRESRDDDLSDLNPALELTSNPYRTFRGELSARTSLPSHCTVSLVSYDRGYLALAHCEPAEPPWPFGSRLPLVPQPPVQWEVDAGEFYRNRQSYRDQFERKVRAAIAAGEFVSQNAFVVPLAQSSDPRRYDWWVRASGEVVGEAPADDLSDWRDTCADDPAGA